jgi:hypothetical protein
MLTKRLAVYVPSTNYNEKITKKEFEERTKKTALKLCEVCGGATVERVNGYYKADNGELIAEKINKVIAYFESEDNAEAIRSYAEDIKKEWKQESIGLELNGSMLFI